MFHSIKLYWLCKAVPNIPSLYFYSMSWDLCNPQRSLFINFACISILLVLFTWQYYFPIQIAPNICQTIQFSCPIKKFSDTLTHAVPCTVKRRKRKEEYLYRLLPLNNLQVTLGEESKMAKRVHSMCVDKNRQTIDKYHSSKRVRYKYTTFQIQFIGANRRITQKVKK